MTPQDLEQTLKTLAQAGTRLADEDGHEVWAFEVDGRTHHLHFHPPGASAKAAQREFYGLQAMQKAKAPAVRTLAMLVGFALGGRKGNAVLVLPPVNPTRLDAVLGQLRISPNSSLHRELLLQCIGLLEKMGLAKLGHERLRPGAFVLSEGRVLLADGAGVTQSGLHMGSIYQLEAEAHGDLSSADRLRAWKRLGQGAPMPAANPVLRPTRQRLVRSAMRGEGGFVRLEDGGWRGVAFARTERPVPWAAASRMEFGAEDWRAAWASLLDLIAAGQFETIKEDEAGRVCSGELVIGGRPIGVIVKRPGRSRWQRYVSDVFMGGRAWRAWKKGWQLIARDVPCAWPLAVMQRTVLGYPVEEMLVIERIEGFGLDQVPWRGSEPARYLRLLWRCGATLRKLESAGLYFYDSKTTNWMVRRDGAGGDLPMIIDFDSIRSLKQGDPLPRFLRSLREGPGYEPAHAAAVALGYAPRARIERIAQLAGDADPAVARAASARIAEGAPA